MREEDNMYMTTKIKSSISVDNYELCHLQSTVDTVHLMILF